MATTNEARTTHLGQGLTVGEVLDLREAATDDHLRAICDDALECDQPALRLVRDEIARRSR